MWVLTHILFVGILSLQASLQPALAVNWGDPYDQGHLQDGDKDFLYETFPDDFLWVAATAAYQVEGAWNEDGESDVRVGKKLIKFGPI